MIQNKLMDMHPPERPKQRPDSSRKRAACCTLTVNGADRNTQTQIIPPENLLASPRPPLRPPVSEVEFVAKNVLALDRTDGGFAEPARAPLFTADAGTTHSHGVGNLVAQIEVAADAFAVEAVETEDGPRVVEVDGVFDLTALGNAVGVVIHKVHRQ